MKAAIDKVSALEEVLDKDINPNTLKKYIRYAFDNCFEDDNTVDFKLGYDLEFIQKAEVKPDYNNNIIVCFTVKNNMQKLMEGETCIYENDDVGLSGCTPNNSECAIWVRVDNLDDHQYYFLVFALFHEIFHRITFNGCGIMDQNYYSFDHVSHIADTNHDNGRGLVSYG